MYTYVIIWLLVAGFSVPLIPAEDTVQCGRGETLIYGICVKYATKIGESCEQSFLVCNGIANSYCSIDKTCQCRWNYLQSGNMCYPGPNAACVVKSLDPCLFSGAKCSEITHKCECLPQYYYYVGSCQPYRLRLNESCSHDFACRRIKNSECIEKHCKCSEGYKAVGGNCVVRLNAPCKLDQDCNPPISNSKCSQTNHRCSCIDNYLEYQGACHPSNLRLGATCTTPFSCGTPNSICREGTCQCDWGYIKRGIYCAP